MGMFDGTSLRRSSFAPPINAAHVAFTGLFCIWRLYTELLKLDYPNLEVVYVSSSIDAAVKAHTRPSTVIVLEKNRFSAGRLRQAVHDTLEIRKYNRMAVKGVTDSLFALWSRQWAKHHL
jgi:hypothetical protein